MPISLPGSAFEYNKYLSVLPSLWDREPKEGKQVIPIEIDWADGAVQHVNIKGLTTQPFEQIIAVYINNVRTFSTVTLYFVDSGCVIDIPAGDQILIPITTRSLEFYIFAANPGAGDITFLQLFNSQPPPVGLSAVQLESTITVISMELPTEGSVFLLPNGINGNITAIDITVTNVLGDPANTSTAAISIADNPPTLDASSLKFYCPIEAGAAVLIPVVTLLRLSGIVVPFRNGLAAYITYPASPHLFVSGVVSINISYQS